MPKVLDLPKAQRVLKEKQAFEQLSKSLNATPTQEQVYQQAYGSAYPVFSEDFGLPRIQESLRSVAKGGISPDEQIRQQLIRPKRERKYTNRISKALGNIEDPLARQGLFNQLLGGRRAAIENETQRRLTALNTANELGQQDFQRAYEQTAGQEQRANAFEDMLKELQLKQSFSGGGYGSRSSQGVDMSQIDALAHAILDGELTLNDVGYDLQGPVAAKVAQLRASGGTGGDTTQSEETVPQRTYVDDLADYLNKNKLYSNRDIVNAAANRGQNIVNKVGSSLGNAVGGIVNWFRR